MRKLLLILFLLVLTTGIRAQYKPVLFGLRAAANLGWIKPDAEGYSNDGAELGFTWGFMGQFFLMENYAILTGFNVNFNGGNLTYLAPLPIDNNDTVPIGMLSRNYNLKYIQIPLCLKMQADVSEKIRIFGKIGLGTAFLLNAKAKDSFNYEDQDYNETRDISEEIALMRESLIIGGGMELILKGSTALVIDLTYDNGLNNIFTQDNPATPAVTPKAFHNFVELGAGIIF